MSPFSSKARTRLAEEFAEIYRIAQDDYRELLNALRDDTVGFDAFGARTGELMEKLLTLKRIRIQLAQEKEDLERRSE